MSQRAGLRKVNGKKLSKKKKGKTFKWFFVPLLSSQKSQISSFQKGHKESRKPETKNNLVLDNYLKIPILLFFAKICVVVRCMYCTLPLAAKYRHVILHCICLVKLIEHMLILVQLKWSSAYQIQCPIHLVSIRVLTIVRMRAFFLLQ